MKLLNEVLTREKHDQRKLTIDSKNLDKNLAGYPLRKTAPVVLNNQNKMEPKKKAMEANIRPLGVSTDEDFLKSASRCGLRK